MEPERKIEKLLRAYAKKRQADAGQPLEMHPATRKMLQGEIGRRSAPGDRARSSENTLFGVFNRRLVFALSFLALLLLGLTILLPYIKEKPAAIAQTEADMSKSDEIAPAAEPPAAPAEREIASANSRLKREVAPPAASAPASPAAAVEGASVFNGAASLAASAPTGEILFKNSADYSTNAVVADFAETRAAIDEALAPSVKDPNIATRYTSLGIETQAATLSLIGGGQKFARTEDPAGQRSEPAGPQPLLSFTMTQTGDKLQIVDADGSIYTGELATADTRLYALRDANESERSAGAAPGAPARQARENVDYFFRVNGSNVSLRQNLVFTGRVSIAGAAPRLDAQSLTLSRSNSGVPALPLYNARIQGKVILGPNQEHELNAVPAAQ